MEPNQKPHSRKKTVVQGTAGVNKGKKVNTAGPVGSQQPRSGSRATGSQQRLGAKRSAAGPSLLSIFLGLPKKARRVILIILAIVGVVFLIRYMRNGGGETSFDDYSVGETYTAAPEADPGEAADLSVAAEARNKRVTPLGGGADRVTVMIYMCGTDLESKYGMATSDLQEMTKAQIADNVNVIVETGGCKQWKNSIVSSSYNQIYKVETGGMKRLEEDFGTAAMTDPANLTTFIDYCEENYPAERSILILWDHGGGSLTGYGYDEKHPAGSSMTLSQIDKALENAGCVFDWIGFDACLMATLETALVCNQYADYMIASEETEPGTGWHYTGWLTKLSENTSIPTVTLSKTLIDDFVSASRAASGRAQVTLSVIDLAELQGTVPPAFRDFATSTTALLKGDEYTQVSDARAGVRQFAQSSRLNQVDLIDLAQRIGTEESLALAQALSGCVKYNSSTISRAYGVSIYFPYESLSSMNGAVSAYNALGIDSEYTKCIQSFASLEQGGQMAASASQSSSLLGGLSGSDLLGGLLESYTGGASSSASSPLGSLLGSYLGGGGSASAGGSLDVQTVVGLLSAFSGRSMPETLSWVDTELVASSAESIAESYIDPGRITVTDRDGRRVLSLTEEEWTLIQTVELNIFVDDGEGYIDLGYDNVFEFDGNDLLLDHDGTWLTLDGHAAAYYLVSDTQNADGSYTTLGRIPALLNGETVNLQVVFDDEHPQGIVTGAYPLYDGETETQAKGDIAVSEGDEIQLLCDYYGYDGAYSASYTLGESFTVTAAGLTLANMALEDDTPCSVTYRLTDVYGNRYWTPAWEA